MHYFIDGYNLLFHLKSAHDDLERQRNWLIDYLSHLLTAVELDVTVVFDSTYQFGDSSRSHLGDMEIIFTAEKETADEFIIDQFRGRPGSKSETVVTSDKKLAWHVRSLGAKTEGVYEFLNRLEKSYKNRLRRKKSEAILISTGKGKTVPLKLPQNPEEKTPSPQSSAEECQTYYERIFEAEFQEIIEKERSRKEALPRKRGSYPSITKALPERSFQDHRSQEEKWLQAFEESFNREQDPYL